MSSQRVPRCSKDAARALSGSNYTDRTKEGSVKPSVATKRSLGCPREGAGGPAPGVVPGFVWKWGLRHEVFPYIRMFKFHENELLFFCEEEETEAQNIHTSLLSSFLTLRSLSFTVCKSRRVSRDRRRSRLRCSAPMSPFHPPLSQFAFPTDSGFFDFLQTQNFHRESKGQGPSHVRTAVRLPVHVMGYIWLSSAAGAGRGGFPGPRPRGRPGRSPSWASAVWSFLTFPFPFTLVPYGLLSTPQPK